MPKLNDTQTILLSTASRRDDGSLYPLPEGREAGPRITKAIATLLAAGLIDERETSGSAAASRTDRDIRYGLYITEAGLRAISVEPGALSAMGDRAAIATCEAAPAAPRQTKIALVAELLQRDEGATLPELIAATDWLPHTTRAALTGLRKKGHAIARSERVGVTHYHITAAL